MKPREKKLFFHDKEKCYCGKKDILKEKRKAVISSVHKSLCALKPSLDLHWSELWLNEKSDVQFIV